MNTPADITQEILRHSLDMALRLHARAVLVYADIFSGIDEIETYL
jgi:hypothetical protein